MLIWLDAASKKKLNSNFDSFVSAEIPDPERDPVGYAAVSNFMIHGPCGFRGKNSPCMKDNKCSKHFPKSSLINTFLGFADPLKHKINYIFFLLCRLSTNLF